MSKLLFHYMNEYILYCIVLIYSFSIGILLLFIFFLILDTVKKLYLLYCIKINLKRF